MRPNLAVLFLLVVVASAVYIKRDAIFTRWQTYKSPDRTFSLELPGEPKLIDKAYAKYPTVHSVNAVVKRDTVFSCEYLTSHELSESADDLRDAASALQPLMGLNALSDRQFTSNGHPARELRLSGGNDLTVDVRILLVGNRMYFLMVAGPSGDRNPDSIHRFFESFKPAA